MHRAKILALTLACTTPLAPRFAFADPTPAAAAPASAEDRAAAETLFYAGRGLMEDGRFPEACRKFEESYRLEAAPGTLLNLALCHEKEGKIASAWAEYRAAILDARRIGRGDREQVARERVEALEPRLPKLVVEVPDESRVVGLVVTRNGVRLAGGAWGEALPVDPGHIELRAEAPGHVPWTSAHTVAEAESITVAIPRLVPKPEVKPEVFAPLPERRSWSARKTLALGIGAAGVAAVGSGAYFGVLALEGKRESDAACPTVNGELRCTPVGARAMDGAQTHAWVSNVGIGVGALAIAAAVYLYVTDDPGSKGQGTTGVAKPKRARATWAGPQSFRIEF